MTNERNTQINTENPETDFKSLLLEAIKRSGRDVSVDEDGVIVIRRISRRGRAETDI